jgi:hypothetical protein
MPVERRDVWRNLPAAVRRAIVDDLAAVLREVNDEIGAYQANHLDRKAVVYVRQSSPQQVINNHLSRSPSEGRAPPSDAAHSAQAFRQFAPSSEMSPASLHLQRARV